MRKLVILIVVSSLLTGCTTLKGWESIGFVQRYAESKKLSQAVEMLAKGDSPGAVKMLTAICSASSVPGVTDEALFRLALLLMEPGSPTSGQGHRLMMRLQKEYPTSPWAVQAARLTEYLNATEDLRHQSQSWETDKKALKADNQALKADNQNLKSHNHNLKTDNQSLKTDNQNLKSANQSLTAEVNELNNNLQQLKHLDLELERKTR
jgi:cell division protein FtsB